MDLTVIRNKKQLLNFIELLNNRRLPFKIAVEDLYPLRSLDLNAYLWGVVYKYISQETGQSIDSIHDGYKRKFNLRIELVYNQAKGIYEPILETGSTATLNNKEFVDYIFAVRADAEIELHICIPNPNESFVPELDFDHDKIEQRRI